MLEQSNPHNENRCWLRRIGVLKGSRWYDGFTPEFIEEVIGLSLGVTSPEGEYEARLNTYHLPQGAVTFWTFTRTNLQGEAEIWTPSAPKNKEYLAKINMRFMLREENRHKLPINPKTPLYDPNETLEGVIEEMIDRNPQPAEHARRQIFSDPIILDFVLNGPRGLAR